MKHTWDLTVTPPEEDALIDLLDCCTDSPATADTSVPDVTTQPNPPVLSSPGCDPNYTPCIPTHPPDLDCGDLGHPITVAGPADPHQLDADGDGIGCET